MKTCPNCNNQLEDNAAFCNYCGYNFFVQQPGDRPFQDAPAYGPAIIDPTDHTAEFDKKDISDNKVIAMVVYLLGTIGILIALLAGNSSPYAFFHVRQALKIVVCEVLVVIATSVLCWTLIVPIAGVVCLGILTVIKIICFVDICQGKAKEPAIIKNLTFLK